MPTSVTFTLSEEGEFVWEGAILFQCPPRGICGRSMTWVTLVHSHQVLPSKDPLKKYEARDIWSGLAHGAESAVGDSQASDQPLLRVEASQGRDCSSSCPRTGQDGGDDTDPRSTWNLGRCYHGMDVACCNHCMNPVSVVLRREFATWEV